MLNRLQVRGKLTLLVIVPLVTVALLLVPLVVDRLEVARSAGATSRTAALARDAGVLVEDLQTVRLLAVAYLAVPDAEPGELGLAVAAAEARRVALAQTARVAGEDVLAARLDGLAVVGELGRRVLVRRASEDAVVFTMSEAIGTVIGSLDLTNATGQGADRLAALDILLRADESSARAGALVLLAGISTGARREVVLDAVAEAEAAAVALGGQFIRLAPGEVADLLGQASGGRSATRLAEARGLIERSGPDRVADRVAVEVYTAVRAENSARQLVQTRVAQDVAVTAGDAAAASARAVLVVAVLVVLLFLLVVGLTVVVGRSVSRPLRRLTRAATRVADLAQAELLRVADEDDAQDVTPRLAAVEVGTDDEIGELAHAFNRVQASAALLLQRQLVSRRNVATMFAGVGRRTSNLVGRQLALIDRLERSEDDPDTLAMLYRLDHVSTRLRRNAFSLIVLSGSTESPEQGRPVAVAAAARAALGTVEEYHRVLIGRLPDVLLAPDAASDIILLLAELIENAVLFSPPSSTVEIEAERTADGGLVLVVVDHGLGMSPDRLEVENARLKQRERLDLAPTDVLGLFVVGRIARRHRLDVRLEPTDDHGVTVVVGLPAGLLVDAGDLPEPEPEPESEPEPAHTEPGRLRQRGPQREEVPVAAATLPAAPSAAPPADPVAVRRRVPGRALGAFDTTSAVVASPRSVDADEVRSVLDGVDEAVDRALSAPAEPTVRTRRRQAAALIQQPAARAVPDPAPDPVPDAVEAAPPADTSAGTPVLARRSPGQALAALEAVQRQSLESRGLPLVPVPVPVATAPERPEDVLRWTDDLETAMVRADDVLAAADPTEPDPETGVPR